MKYEKLKHFQATAGSGSGFVPIINMYERALLISGNEE
jgi:hypothetical protein